MVVYRKKIEDCKNEQCVRDFGLMIETPVVLVEEFGSNDSAQTKPVEDFETGGDYHHHHDYEVEGDYSLPEEEIADQDAEEVCRIEETVVLVLESAERQVEGGKKRNFIIKFYLDM